MNRRRLFSTSMIAIGILIILIPTINRQMDIWLSILLTLFGGSISILSSWFFSSISKNRWIFKIINLLEGSQIIGLKSIEPKLKLGTSSLTALRNDFNSSFDFLGVGGSKFIEEMLCEETIMDKIRANECKVRIMLLDPNGTKINNWLQGEKRDETKQLIENSIKLLKEKVAKNNCQIHLRLYDKRPPMRIQIINREIAYICEYDPLHDGDEGPQLIFDKNEGDHDLKRPFVESLNNLYDFLWEKADKELF